MSEDKNRTATNRPVMLRDVAEAAGVSMATASKALNETGRMSAETRQRIVKIAKSLNFRPNDIARSLTKKRSFTIGFLNNDLTGRLTLPVMAGVTSALFDQGVSVFLCSIEDHPAIARRHVETMLEKRVDGIIAAGKRTDRQVPVELSGLGIPVVYTIVQPEENSVCFVPDDVAGARMATEFLISKSRRRIAHVTGPANFRVVHERVLGYREALQGADLVEPEFGILMDDWSERAGYEAAAILFNGGAAPPDAVFCGNDQIARGMVDALSLMGKRVPDDVSIVGFDNWKMFAEATRPPLTSVDMNLEDLGRIAGETLLRMIDGETIEPGVRKLPCRIEVRKSA